MSRPGVGSATPRATGFTLLEVIVALMILHVSVLGVLGMFALASRRLTEARFLEGAAAEAQAVADSLSWLEAPGSGESIRGEWRVSWEGGEGALEVRVHRLGREDLGALFAVELP